LAAVSLDAVTAWARWRNLLGSHGITAGPVWRGVDRYGRRPRTRGRTRNSNRLIIVRRAHAAGLDARMWGAHSLRRGFATEAILVQPPLQLRDLRSRPSSTAAA